jgi:hypothetical protein
MGDEWFRFEQHRRTEVTVFDLDGVAARAGARGTRFFKSDVLVAANPKQIVRDAVQLMDKWPAGKWPRPAGLESHEQPIVLPALQEAMGRMPSRQ